MKIIANVFLILVVIFMGADVIFAQTPPPPPAPPAQTPLPSGLYLLLAIGAGCWGLFRKKSKKI